MNKKHFFLVSGEVTYSVGEGPIQTSGANAIHTQDKETFVGKDLAKIQTALQLYFHTVHSRTSPTPPEIHNVVILGIFPLGQHDPKIFNAGIPKPNTKK